MFKKKEELNIKKINETVSLTKKILQLLYFLIVVFGIYIVTIILKEWKILDFLFTIISVLSPLFVGVLIAWLFNPLVKFMQDKGIKRKIGTIITYFLIIIFFVILIGSVFPMISREITSLAESSPSILFDVTKWSENLFENMDNTFNIESKSFQDEVYTHIEDYFEGITSSLPTFILNVGSSIISGLASFVVGLVIGFFFLIGFEDVSGAVNFLPRRMQKDTLNLTMKVEKSLRRYVRGALIDSTVVFLISSLAFSIIGLQSPLLFGLICGITNIIPYVGPYIGGFPAAIIGLSQSVTIGILTIIAIAIIQFLEGNFLQPVILSKTTKLHPVLIIMGLLVFGYFWGILGMIVATPILATLKAIFLFFEEKYDLFTFEEETE